MANVVRIKRRASGNPGAPASLQNAELAYNEVDDTLYYGKGTGGVGGAATSVEAIAGAGAFVTKSGSQTISGAKTFDTPVGVPTPVDPGHAVNKAYADALTPNLEGGSGISVTGTGTKTIAADGTIARLESPAFTGAPTAPTPANATNTTQIATTAFVKAQGYLTTAPVTSVAGKTGVVTLAKADVGLGNVDNTSDASKPVSTAQQAALDAKAPLASPALTGTPTAPTAAVATSTTQIATTAFVKAQGYLTTAPVTSVAGKTGVVSLVKADVGLGNVDNTPDASKPVSTAQQAALDAKAPLASPELTGVPTAPTALASADSAQIATTAFVKAQGYLTTAPVASVAGKTGVVTLVKGDVGLGNVDNTSDASKPVSTAQQAALDAKAPLASPALTGTPSAPTAIASTNTTQIATTAFVKSQGYLTTAPVTSVAGKTGAVTLAVADVTGAAPLASPTLTGTPAAPTAATATNSTQIATTAFVQAVVASLIGSAPGVLDTLAEIAAALGNDPDFAATITTELTAKMVKANNLSDLTNVATARNNLGLGTIATQSASNVTITGGSIDGITLDGGTF